MFKLVVLGLASIAVAVPAAAQAPAAQASAAVQKDKDPNRIICEREEVIGSRLGGQKICKTAHEWQESRQQAREQIDDWQRRLPALPKPGEGG